MSQKVLSRGFIVCFGLLVTIGQRYIHPGLLHTSFLLTMWENFNSGGKTFLLWLCWPIPLHVPDYEEEEPPGYLLEK